MAPRAIDLVLATIRAPGQDRSSVLNLLQREAEQSGMSVRWISPASDATTQHDAQEFATDVLWLGHHGLFDHRDVIDTDLVRTGAAFRRVNQSVSRSIAASLSTVRFGVVVNDYQLSLVPKMLRKARFPTPPILYMSYTPFAAAGAWRKLPRGPRTEVLNGILGADVVGFASARWSEAFVETACADAGWSWSPEHGELRSAERRVAVHEYAVGIDIAAVRRQAAHSSSSGQRFRSHDGVTLIARADRLDPAKNALVGFLAYERLLADHAALRGTVHFAACLSPSRQHLRSYRDYREQVIATARRIEARWPGSLSIYEGESHDRALALMEQADVMLVNSVADGMNLVAQEFVAVGKRDGVLILSRQTGSYDLLGPGALGIDGSASVATTALALHRAVRQSAAERCSRSATLRAALYARRGRLLDGVTRDLQTVRAHLFTD